ncbi:MAG: hypothetical protein Tsb0021_18070 [Chlamydiales bacterium]
MTEEITEKSLPDFRPDLEIFKGPDEPDGTPTYSIYDPVAERYIKISWIEATIFQLIKPGDTLRALLEKVNQNTTLTLSLQDIESFYNYAEKLNLLSRPISSDKILEEYEKQQGSWIKWIFYKYLYFRIPLFNPDHFLEKTLPIAMLFCSRIALILYALFSIFGFTMLVIHFDDYIATFPYFFNVEGFAMYIGAVLIVKIIHELAHAYTAKYYGITVPRIGVAVVVFFPMFFTDVTHGWRLEKRSHRLMITAAGLISELITAGIALFFWNMASPGIWKSIFFVVSSTTLITSLLVNLNPVIRFDGYYLLADLWGIDNLQSRAYAVAQWKLRQWFLGIHTPCPEHYLPTKRMIGMVTYSIFAWLYRITITLGIAYIIYGTLTKALSVPLVLMMVLLTFLSPFISEFQTLKKMSDKIRFNFRMLLTSVALTFALLWFVLPLPHTQYFPAITVPSREDVVYIPLEGVIEKIYTKRDAEVHVGMPLLKLTYPPLQAEILALKKEAELVERQIDIITTEQDSKERSYLPQKYQELATLEERIAALENLSAQLTILAEMSGTLYSWNDDLWKGQVLRRNEMIGKIAEMQDIDVRAYITEGKENILSPGDKVTFRANNTLRRFKGKVISTQKVGEIILKDPILSSIAGGEIPVDQNFKLKEGYSIVRVRLEDPRDLRFGQKGWIAVEGPWESYLVTYLRRSLSFLWRESGF